MSTSAVVALIKYGSGDKTTARKFDLMINFDFLRPNNFEIAHAISVKFGF